MAYDIKTLLGFGTGLLDDVEISDGVIENVNSYARIIKIDELNDDKVAIDTESAVIGRYEDFSAGNDVLIHVSASAKETEYLGKYMVATILLAQNGLLTLSKKITDLIPRDQFEFYTLQMVTAANFDCLTLKEGGVIMPPVFDIHKLCGGILFIRVFDSLKFEGGHISLGDSGIPSNAKHLFRPLTEQETAANGEGDFAKFSGQENFITSERLLLNAGDGALILAAKNIYCNEKSRIGNVDTHGAHFCRGAENSVGVKPANVTNIGGSTILIAAENIVDFNAKIIAKYRNAATKESEVGRGLCRCYIASNTPLRNDEGLYAYDVLHTPSFLDAVNIHDFGSGTFGSIANPTKAINNYARVTAINQGGCRLTLADETVNGLTPLDVDTLVIVQVIQKSHLHTQHAGEIVTAKVMSRGENYVVIDTPAPSASLENYAMQIISVPQFVNFTLNTNYTGTPKFNGKVGGVFAVAANTLCDISEGKINLEGKGGAPAYGREGLEFIGNAQDFNRLPLGEGHGSAFILAKTLKLNANSRIGATYSGLGTGDRFGGGNATQSNLGGGYRGDVDNEGTGSAGGYIGGGSYAGNARYGGLGGSGASGGTSENFRELETSKITGGYGSNGKANGAYEGGKQGAHIFVVADKIENFSQACFSTGGEGGQGGIYQDGINGAAGFGGGASAKGSSGGSGGFCFIYCN